MTICFNLGERGRETTNECTYTLCGATPTLLKPLGFRIEFIGIAFELKELSRGVCQSGVRVRLREWKGETSKFSVRRSLPPSLRPNPFICENEQSHPAKKESENVCVCSSRVVEKWREREEEMKFCRVLVGTVSVFQPLVRSLLSLPNRCLAC